MLFPFSFREYFQVNQPLVLGGDIWYFGGRASLIALSPSFAWSKSEAVFQHFSKWFAMNPSNGPVKETSACGYTFWDIRGFFCLHNASQDFFEPQLKIWRSNNIIALGDFDFDFCSRPHFLKVQNQLEHSSVNHLGPKDFGTSIETHVAYFWHAIKSLACGVVSELYSSNESNIIAMAKMVQPLWCCVFHSKESRLSCWNR